jgi:hypothetical protein
MSTGSNFSVEFLFAQIVSRRLELWSPASRMSHAHAFDQDYSDDFPFDFPSPSVDIGLRLSKLETAVESIDDRMGQILRLLTHSAALGQVRERDPDVVSPSKSHNSSRGSSSSVSPEGFQFVCPLCLKPQLTPKSHCEHLKNSVGSGVHVCRFVPEHNRHNRIVTIFDSPDVFVQW